MNDPVKTTNVNFTATMNMLSLAESVKARILLTSSFEIYDDPKIDVRIARIFNTFGPRMLVNDGTSISNFILQALRDEPITIYDYDTKVQMETFQYIDDLVDGLIALMNSDTSLSVNFGNPEGYTKEELADLIICLARSKSGVIYFAKHKDEPMQEIPDITRATELLNWKPKTSIEDGLTKTLEYFQNELEQNISGADLYQTYPDVSETEMEYSYDYEKLANCFHLKNQQTFPLFDAPFISWKRDGETRHIFRSISDFVFANNFNNLKPENVKCGNIIYVTTDFIEEFLLEYHPKIRNLYVLLTHESEYAVGYTWQMEILNELKIIKWFAQNTLSSHPKLVPLPLGIELSAGNAFSTFYDLARNVTPYHNKTQLLYLNLSPNTNQETLAYFQKTFGNNSLVKFDENTTSWKECLENIKNSQFVLNPSGDGIDSIRTWEALYLGSVPIVQESYIQPLYDDMPVMVVKDWSEVTEESMKKFQKEKLKNFSKDGLPWRKKIWLRYWINEIIKTKLDYIHNFCS